MTASEQVKIREYADKIARRLWERFDERRGDLLKIAKVFEPRLLATLRQGASDKDMRGLKRKLKPALTIAPREALRKSEGGFSVNLTSRANHWFSLVMDGVDDADQSERARFVRMFLDQFRDRVEKRMERSGFHTQNTYIYRHLLLFDFACLWYRQRVDFSTQVIALRPGLYALGDDGNGNITRLVHRRYLRPEELVSEYGEDVVPERVRKAGRDTYFEVNMLFEPNDDVGSEIGNILDVDLSMAYRSCEWIGRGTLKDEGGVLRVSGYRIKPFSAPRYDAMEGETYGSGARAELCLGIARGLEQLRSDEFLISGENASPALLASSDMEAKGVDTSRGAMNFGNGEQVKDRVVRVQGEPSNGQATVNTFDRVNAELNSGFFVDAFNALESHKRNKQPATATEIEQAKVEALQQVFPVVSRLDNYLDEVVSAFAMHQLAEDIAYGVIPTEHLPLVDYVFNAVKIHYCSRIHLAMENTQVQATMGWLDQVAAMAKAGRQEALMYVDVHATLPSLARMQGVPAAFVKSTEAVMAEIRQMQQAQAQAAQMAQMKDMAEAAGKVGAIPTDPNHVAGKLIEGAQGNAV